MKRTLKKLPLAQSTYRAVRPLFPQRRKKVIQSYWRFWRSFFHYKQLQGSAPCPWADLDPCLGDWHSETPLSYYFYQDTWAFRKVALARPRRHMDIGSTALLVGCLAGIVPTISLDVRPLVAALQGLESVCGLVTQLPFASASIESLTSLCVLEHIGLGRYGDPIDPEGTVKAARELTRVLATGGNLYVSVPCGRSYVAFNAYRSFAKPEFTRLFPGLTLADFVMVNNRGRIETTPPPPEHGLEVGLFHFRK